MSLTYAEIALVFLGIFAGGFLKGATGAGAPVIGVPILAVVLDVTIAVAIFSVLNLVSNIWHSWAYRTHRGSPRFVFGFAISGAIGAVIGSFLLAGLPTQFLMAGLGGIVFLYIALRMARPQWRLQREIGERFANPTGLLGGIMQGAGGISAPVSVTYLNAMQLSRDEFIATISIFFVAMAALQVPTLAYLGIVTTQTLLLCVFAAIPLFAAIPVGEWAARFMSRQTFDRLILVVLAVIAVRLIWAALT